MVPFRDLFLQGPDLATLRTCPLWDVCALCGTLVMSYYSWNKVVVFTYLILFFRFPVFPKWPILLFSAWSNDPFQRSLTSKAITSFLDKTWNLKMLRMVDLLYLVISIYFLKKSEKTRKKGKCQGKYFVCHDQYYPCIIMKIRKICF